MATARTLDFATRYRPEDVDRVVAEAADEVASLSGLGSAGTIAVVLRRLVDAAAEHEADEIEVGEGRFTVRKYEAGGDVRIYLDLGGIRPDVTLQSS